jgi:hypothetical protein
MEANGYKIEPGAELGGANLYCEDLTGADLRGANLRYASLEGANLTGASLEGACLDSTALDSAILIGADLRGANLGCANLAGADLRDADLRGADLRFANLFGADLRGAQLSEAKLQGARFWCADLSGVALTRGQLTEASFSGAILVDAAFNYINKASDTAIEKALRAADVNRAEYNKIDSDDDYEHYIETAEALISCIFDCIESTLWIAMPRGEQRLEVIKQLRFVAAAINAYNDCESDEPQDWLCENLITYLDRAFYTILNPIAKKSRKADVPRFLSEIGFKIDVEVNVTPENQDSIEARLDQLSSDVADLAGISKQETPAKTVLAAIEASNLTPEIMDMVINAVFDCADMG